MFIHWFITWVDLKYPDKQLFLSGPVFPSAIFRRHWAADESPSARLRLVQQVEGEMSTRGPFARIGLCAAAQEKKQKKKKWLDVRHCVCSRPSASGSRSSHLVRKKFRTGHEPAICSSRPSAASSQKHFSYWRTEESNSRNVWKETLCTGTHSHCCRFCFLYDISHVKYNTW